MYHLMKQSVDLSPLSSSVSPVAIISLLGVASLTIMVGCVIVPGLPTISVALGVPHAAGWLVTLPSLGVVLFGPLAGRIIDRAGPFRALCAGLLGYGVLGVGAIALHGAVLIFTDRLLLGGVTSVVMASGTALLSSLYTGEKRLRMIAIQGMSIEIGGVIFLSAGGILAGMVGWTAPFFLYLMAILLLVLVWCSVPRVAGVADDTDGATDNSASPSLLPVMFSAFCSLAIFFSAIIMLPFRLMHFGAAGQSLSESQIGYFLSGVSVMAVFAAASMPHVARRVGQEGTLITGFISFCVAHLLFAFGEALPLFIIGGVFAGFGFGLTIPMVNHMTVERSPVARRGSNLAYLSMAIFMGQFMSSFSQFVPGGPRVVFFCVAGFAACVAVSGALSWLRPRLRTA